MDLFYTYAFYFPPCYPEGGISLLTQGQSHLSSAQSYPSQVIISLLNSFNAFFISFFSSLDTLGFFPSLKSIPWASLGVQWLERRASTAGGAGSTPQWGTKILHAAWRGQKKGNPVFPGSHIPFQSLFRLFPPTAVSILIFYLFRLHWLFVAVLRLFPGCGGWGLLSSCGTRTSHCGAFSCCRGQALGTWASVAAACGL